jgi:OmcA/MtrC family decaheme c-type cytochrome
VAAIEGHPAAIVDPIDKPGVYEEVPVRNAFRYFGITDLVPEPRREVVGLDRCNKCHDYLSLHGGNRQGAIEVCVICHNPDATDIIVRPATLDVAPQDDIFDDFTAVDADGKREQAIHLKHMVHALHAGEAGKFGFRQDGIAVRGFGRFSLNDYSDMRYPGILSNCAACHDGDSYGLPTPTGSLGTTVQTASPRLAGNQAAAEASLADPADDLNISPMASACGSCHDSDSARAHIVNTGGGAFDVPQAVVDGVLVEACGGCHGPGEIQDVFRVHDIHPVP